LKTVLVFPSELWYFNYMKEPSTVEKTSAYLVAYKPPRMHSVPLKKQEEPDNRDETLLDWCSRLYPEVLEVRGRNPWEGGILHRLDYETEGLVLFARTQEAMDSLLVQQQEGRFSKEYGALSGGAATVLPGFPLAPSMPSVKNADPIVIETGFRPYGPGRKTVRPVVQEGSPYRTEVLSMESHGDYTLFRARIQRGFRHQIRCHLAWLGYPLVNDLLYGGRILAGFPPLNNDEISGRAGEAPARPPAETPFLALKAQGISFCDPASGEYREYSLPPIAPPPF
jgi:23S rRNA pseudouridine1911/1915/1917 synthase